MDTSRKQEEQNGVEKRLAQFVFHHEANNSLLVQQKLVN